MPENPIFKIILFIISGLTLIGLLALLYIIIASFWNPITRKIGIRNIKRRLGNTFLVILGSLVGAALVSGSLVLYDSLAQTFVNLTEEMVGEVDAIIELKETNLTDQNISAINKEQVEKIRDKLKNKKEIDGFVPTLNFRVSPAKLNENNEPVINEYNLDLIALDFDEIKNFGQEPQDYLKEFKNNEIITSESVAKRLELKQGDKLLTNYGSVKLEMVVAGIYEDKGIVGGANILISNEFLSKKLGFTENAYNKMWVSAKGGVKPDNYKGDDFEKIIKENIEEVELENYELTVEEIKEDILDGYGMKNFALIFLVFSLFGIFAGILLVINLYSMLAQERKTEMGILRAIALTRWGLIRSFVCEGTLYSLFSSIAGSALGIGIGYFLIGSLKNMFEQDTLGGDWLKIKFHFEPRSLLIAFGAGFFITILTSIYASYKNSKLNIVSAIRRLPEQEDKSFSAKWILKLIGQIIILIISLNVLIGSFKVTDSMNQSREDNPESSLAKMSDKSFQEQIDLMQAMMLYFGTIVSSFMLTIIINKILKKSLKKDRGLDKWISTGAAAFNIIFTANMAKFDCIKNAMKIDAGAGLFVASGVVLVISSALIISRHLKTITTPITWLTNKIGWLKSIIRLAFRYPASDYAQTNRTLTMFAIIIYLIVFMIVEQKIIDIEVKEDLENSLGGYHALIQPNPGTKQEQINEIEDKVEKISSVSSSSAILQTLVALPEYKYKDLQEAAFYGDPNLIPEHTEEDSFLTFYNALPPDYLKNTNIELNERDAKYKNDEEVWEAIINDSDKIVIGESFLREGYGKQPELKVGQKIKITDQFNQNEQEKQIIGSIKVNEEGGGEVGFGSTAYLITTNETAEQQFSDEYLDRFSQTNILVKYVNKANHTKTTNEIKKELMEYNISYILSLEQMIGRTSSFMNSMINMFNGFLGFSLIVGTSGLAIIIARAVNERRQQIGMLRSLGLQRWMILIGFYIESTLISALGIIIGVSMSLISVYITFEKIFNMKVTLPVWNIVIVCAVIYGAAMLFSVFPSIKAARMKPVEATNYPE